MSEIKFEILNQEEFCGVFGSSLEQLNGSMDNGDDDNFGLGDWTCQFDVKVDYKGAERQFTVAFQPEERTDRMKAYSGYDLDPASKYGYDADESNELIEFCDGDTFVVDKLADIAKAAAKVDLERLIEEQGTPRPSGP